MAVTLLSIGLLCVIAALVGGGVKIAGGEVPVIQSRKVRITLGLFGVLLVGAAYVQVSSGYLHPKLEDTTWEGSYTYDTTNDPPYTVRTTVPLQIEFRAGTAVVHKSAYYTNEYCSWAPSLGTITLKCVYSRDIGENGHLGLQRSINSVYKLRVNGISMSGTKQDVVDHNNDGSVSLLKKLD